MQMPESFYKLDRDRPQVRQGNLMPPTPPRLLDTSLISKCSTYITGSTLLSHRHRMNVHFQVPTENPESLRWKNSYAFVSDIIILAHLSSVSKHEKLAERGRYRPKQLQQPIYFAGGATVRLFK